MKIILIVILLSAMVTVFIIAENTLMLKIRRERLGSGLKILHISDIHKRRMGENNRRISDIAAKESPDLIFITGDLVSRNETDFTAAKVLIDRLCKVAPVYMVNGNHEQSLPPDKESEFDEILRKTKVIRLINEIRGVTVKGRRLHIAGVQQDYGTYKKNGGYRDLGKFTLPDMKALVGDCPEGEVLLLAHNPKWGQVYADWGARYTFSGHIHGGVVRLFGVGVLSPERKFLPEYSKGIYTIGNMKLLVSAGIGKLRAFNPPELIIYEI